MKNLKFNVEEFKKDYYSGMICLFGDKDEIDKFIGNHSLVYNHRLEERGVLDHSFKVYVACVGKDKYTFKQLTACREIEICRLEEVYPVRENEDEHVVDVLCIKHYDSIGRTHFKAGKIYKATPSPEKRKVYEGQLVVHGEGDSACSINFLREDIYNMHFITIKNNKLEYKKDKIEASKETYWIIKQTNPATGKVSTNKYTDKNQAIDSYDAKSVYNYYNDIKSKIELIEVDAITTYESRLLKDCK